MQSNLIPLEMAALSNYCLINAFRAVLILLLFFIVGALISNIKKYLGCLEGLQPQSAFSRGIEAYHGKP